MVNEEDAIGLPEIVYEGGLSRITVRDFVSFARCPLALLHDYSSSSRKKRNPKRKATKKRVVSALRGQARHARFTAMVKEKEPGLIEDICYELDCCMQRMLDGDGLQEHQMDDIKYFLGQIKKEHIWVSAEENIESKQFEIAGETDISILLNDGSYPRAFPNLVRMPVEFKSGTYPTEDIDFSNLKLGQRFYTNKLQEGLYLLINPLWYDGMMRFGFVLYKEETAGHRARMVILDDELVSDIKTMAPHVRKIRSKHNPVDEQWVIDNYLDLISGDELCNMCFYNMRCLYPSSATAKKTEYVV